MKYTRLYADANGETHFEDLEMPFTGGGRAGELSDLIAVSGIQLQRTKGGESTALDWHTAPRRQFILQLTHATERTVSDGEVRTFGPGTLILVEDTTGKGHITKSVQSGPDERVMLFMHVAE
jgi:hypothetical protein